MIGRRRTPGKRPKARARSRRPPDRSLGRDRRARSGSLLALLLLCAIPGSGLALPPEDEAPAVSRTGAAALHTALEASWPSDGEVVEDELEEIRLRFTTSVQLALSSIELEGPDGPVAEVEPVERVAGTEDRELRVRLLAPLTPGSHTVRWRTAGPDSHPISGELTFEVVGDDPPEPDTVPGTGEPEREAEGGAAPPGPGSAGDREPLGPQEGEAQTAEADGEDGALATLPGLVVHWLFLLSIVGMVGCAAFRALVIPALAREEELAVAVPRMVRGVWRMAWIAAGIGILVLPARLWHQSVLVFGGGALGGENLTNLLFRSSWGGGWFLQAGLTAVFVAGAVAAGGEERRKLGWFAMTLGAVGLSLVPAISGHAWGAEDRVLAVGSHTLHVLAAGSWMGSLGVLVFAGLPAIRALGGRDALPGLLPVLVEGFSRIALFSVGLLVLTGGLNAWVHLDAFGELLSTAYGRALLVKVGVAVAALSLGFYNWRVVRPTLWKDPRPGLLRIPASVEFLIGLTVLALTAYLVSRGLPG